MKKKNEEDFVVFLSTIESQMQDLEFATEVYQSLCNMRWRRKDNPKIIYSCSWRYAAGIIAEIRNQGEDYLDFYCSGNEGVISSRLEIIYSSAGWEPFPWRN